MHARALTVTMPDDPSAPRLAQAGNIYTILVSGSQTQGRYFLVDMLVPEGGGPPPHRHNFEEMFTLLDGELEFTFRGETQVVRAPATVNIPANAPHRFVNVSSKPAHMLCMCTPAGFDDFLMKVAEPVADRQASSPAPDGGAHADKAAEAARIAAEHGIEFL